MRQVRPPVRSVLLLVAALLWGCGDPPEPAPAPAPAKPRAPRRRPRAEPERGPTAVRFELDLPDGVDDGAGVVAWWSAGADHKGAVISETTLADGFLTVQVRHGAGRVDVHVPGCVVLGRDVRAERGRVVDAGRLELVRSTPLVGRVVDPAGAPVPDAFVWPKASGVSVPLSATDDDGGFSFDGLPDGRVELRIECARFVTRRIAYDLQPDAPPAQVALEPGGLVRGRVLAPDGARSETLVVWVTDVIDVEDRDRMAWPRPGEDGRFEVHLAPGRYLVHARRDGREAVSTGVVVEDGGEHDVTLQLLAR